MAGKMFHAIVALHDGTIEDWIDVNVGAEAISPETGILFLAIIRASGGDPEKTMTAADLQQHIQAACESRAIKSEFVHHYAGKEAGH